MSIPTVVLPPGFRALVHTKATQQNDAVVQPTLTFSAKNFSTGLPFSDVGLEISPTDPTAMYVSNSIAQSANVTLVVTITATGSVGAAKTDAFQVTLQSDVRVLKTFSVLASDPPEAIPTP